MFSPYISIVVTLVIVTDYSSKYLIIYCPSPNMVTCEKARGLRGVSLNGVER